VTSETAAMSPDAQVLLLLCSTLGLARDGKPLSASEWKSVSPAIERAGMRPGDLLDMTADETARALAVPATLAARMAELLARGGQLALELQRLQGRGIWVRTRVDQDYPKRLRARLKAQSPAVLCGAGTLPDAEAPALAIVGSRDVDERGLAFTQRLGAACARAGGTVISGGARGVDIAAQEAVLEAGGHVCAVLADSLEKALQKRAVRDAVRDGRLTVMTAVHPSTPFSAGIAMARNKFIYALSSSAVVVASAEGSGGTWAGATENLERGWVPLFVRDGADVPAGNRALIGRGAQAIGEDDEAIAHVVSSLFGHHATPYSAEANPRPAPAHVAEPLPPAYGGDAQAEPVMPATPGKLFD
jgi:DNA processing protein